MSSSSPELSPWVHPARFPSAGRAPGSSESRGDAVSWGLCGQRGASTEVPYNERSRNGLPRGLGGQSVAASVRVGVKVCGLCFTLKSCPCLLW